MRLEGGDLVYRIKDRIKEALELRGMLPIELARKSGINKGSISRYLKGEMIPKQSKIVDMARALNVSPAWLLGYDTPMEGTGDEIVFTKELDTSKLSNENYKKLLGYYQALLDMQEADNGNT